MPDERNAFEDELRLSLSRLEAPAGFAASVLGRVEAEQGVIRPWTEPPGSRVEPVQPVQTHPGRPTQRLLPAIIARQVTQPWGVAAALLLMLLLPLGGYTYQRHEQAKAKAAVEQFALAMRLTQAALINAGDHVAAHGHEHARAQ